MGVRSLAASLVFAGVVWGLVLLVSGGAGGSGIAERVGTPLVSFSPSEVVRVEVKGPAEDTVVLDLDPTGLWIFQLGLEEPSAEDFPSADHEGAGWFGELVVDEDESSMRFERLPDRSWFADEQRVRSALRLLADSVVEASADDSFSEATTVRVELRSGASIALAFAGDAVGGVERVKLNDRVWIVKGGLASVFSLEGVKTWVSSEPFYGIDRNIREIRGHMTVRRTGDRWGMTDPVVARVDPAEVYEWIDSGGVMDGCAGTSYPSLSFRVENASGAPISSWAASTAGTALSVGARLSSGRFVGPWTVPCAALPYDLPHTWISRRAVNIPARTVWAVQVGDDVARREELGWEQPWVEQVLALTTGSEATQVRWDRIGDDAPAAKLLLQDRAGRTVADFDIRLQRRFGADATVLLCNGGACWEYWSQFAESNPSLQTGLNKLRDAGRR